MKQLSKLETKMAIIAITIMFFAGNAHAQTEPKPQRGNSEHKLTFPAQASIFFPYGTHRRKSTDYTFNFSLNSVYGKVGGINGIEVSGLVGRVEGNVNGVQIAGFGNASDNVKGIQIGGFGNAADNVKGIQVAGFGNASDDVKGIQISGFGNAADDMNGIQIGGFGNAADKMTGLQIGLYNRTHTLRGLQIGIISINDTIEKGGPLSLVNIVKKGFYREWELSFSDYANMAFSYKMGTRKIYTIYTVGVNFIEDNLWTAGIGFGNQTPIGNKLDFRPELVSYNYFPMNFKSVQFTSATHLRFGFVCNISEKIGLSFTPSVYVMNMSLRQDMEYYKVSPIKAFYTNEKSNKLTTMGVGFSLGLSFK